jgi:hypothetical protein
MTELWTAERRSHDGRHRRFLAARHAADLIAKLDAAEADERASARRAASRPLERQRQLGAAWHGREPPGGAGRCTPPLQHPLTEVRRWKGLRACADLTQSPSLALAARRTETAPCTGPVIQPLADPSGCSPGTTK